MLELREKIIVSGVPVYLEPYTALRESQLKKVDKEIDEFIDKNKDLSFDKMDITHKAEFWMKKARVLWEPAPRRGASGEVVDLNADFWDEVNGFFTIEFFKDSSFEYPLLKKSQDFFFMQAFFL